MEKAAVKPVASVETGHEDMIVWRGAQPPTLRPSAAQHDAQMDYYGKRLATCSSDHQVRIFNVREDGSHDLAETLAGFVAALSHPRAVC